MKFVCWIPLFSRDFHGTNLLETIEFLQGTCHTALTLPLSLFSLSLSLSLSLSQGFLGSNPGKGFAPRLNLQLIHLKSFKLSVCRKAGAMLKAGSNRSNYYGFLFFSFFDSRALSLHHI